MKYIYFDTAKKNPHTKNLSFFLIRTLKSEHAHAETVIHVWIKLWLNWNAWDDFELIQIVYWACFLLTHLSGKQKHFLQVDQLL